MLLFRIFSSVSRPLALSHPPCVRRRTDSPSRKYKTGKFSPDGSSRANSSWNDDKSPHQWNTDKLSFPCNKQRACVNVLKLRCDWYEKLCNKTSLHRTYSRKPWIERNRLFLKCWCVPSCSSKTINACFYILHMYVIGGHNAKCRSRWNSKLAFLYQKCQKTSLVPTSRFFHVCYLIIEITN